MQTQEDSKIYYPIGEVAQLFGLPVSTIRFWEKEFDILQPHKNKKGNRLFTTKDIENLKLIYHLVKERGYTLSGAKMKLKSSKKEVEVAYEITSSLTSLKSFLVDLKKDL